MILAIETSCDETAVALFKADCEPSVELVASQSKLHEAYGGVVPELAAREHIVNLPILVEKAVAEAGCAMADIKAIAVTRGPGLKGCLLVGLSYAKALAYALSVPLLPLHHIEGHLVAGELLGAQAPKYPRLSLVVSGGAHNVGLLKAV